MKKLLLAATSLIIFSACHDKRDRYPKPEPVLTGGKGGSYSIAVFPEQSDTGVTGRIFIKYASNTAPQDTSHYDEAKTAQAEPGEGPHAHFEELTAGTYFIRAINGSAHADTIIALSSSSPDETDVHLKLK